MTQVNYNEISKIYDDVREADLVLIAHFLRGLPDGERLNILDLGCGTGNYTDLFQKRTSDRACQVYGIDPSPGMIDRARRKNSRITFRQGAAEAIPFEDNFFDFIFMTDVIHHVPDIRRMFREIHRVLKRDGRVCIVTQSHRQIEARPIAQFFPGTVSVDKIRYPDIPEVIEAGISGSLSYEKQEILFEGDAIELGEEFLALVQKKGYSMLHLLSEEEYESGLVLLEQALQSGLIQARMAGETLVWFTKE